MKFFKYIRRKFGHLYLNMGLSIAFAIIVLLVRITLTHSLFYLFLVWNLFLAGVPFFITLLLKKYDRLRNQRHYMIAVFILWLLFLPNSPYIITDLVHLHNEYSYLAWLDLFLVFVFALNGLLIGLFSMMDMQTILLEKLGPLTTKILFFHVCILSGYGIYIGRFLRFNSWDITTKPITIFLKLVESIQNPKAWLFSLAFGSFIWILFGVLQSILSSGTTKKTIK